MSHDTGEQVNPKAIEKVLGFWSMKMSTDDPEACVTNYLLDFKARLTATGYEDVFMNNTKRTIWMLCLSWNHLC